MNSKNAVHAQLFFEFKQFSKNDMRLSGQALSSESTSRAKKIEVRGKAGSEELGADGKLKAEILTLVE